MVRPQDRCRLRERSVEGMAMRLFLCIIEATNASRITCKNMQQNKNTSDAVTEGSHTCTDIKKLKISDNWQKCGNSRFLCLHEINTIRYIVS